MAAPQQLWQSMEPDAAAMTEIATPEKEDSDELYLPLSQLEFMAGSMATEPDLAAEASKVVAPTPPP